MERVKTIGQWMFEIKQIRAIKTPEYGQPFTANALITIVDGEVHIEGLLSKDDCSLIDLTEIEQELLKMGFKHYRYSRFKNGKRRLVKKRIK